jgi:hypothetical protein
MYTQSISLNREPSLDPLTYRHVDFRIGITNSLERSSVLQRPEPELPIEGVKPEDKRESTRDTVHSAEQQEKM